MIETPLNKVLNTMRQYVENIYEHDSEPMLNWKDIKLVLDEIEKLNKEKILLENALRFVMQQDDDFEIDYKQLEKIDYEQLRKQLKELRK